MTEREKTIREQMHEILDIVLDVNGCEARQRKHTGFKPTAFMRFSGHIGFVSVDIYKNGWESGEEYDYFEFSIEEPNKEWKMDQLRRSAKEAESYKSKSEILEREIFELETLLKDHTELLEQKKKELAELGGENV